MRELARAAAIQRILAREARALGLDRGDEIIERRLAQKMDFLIADLASLEPPDQDTLRRWFAANGDQFAQPPRASFRHLYFAPDRRGAATARADAAALLPRLAGIGPEDPRLADLARQADRFMFRDHYGGRSPEELGKDFGPDFARDLFALAPGAWQGPIRSGYGWHLIWIDRLDPARPADFAAIEDQLRAAWLDQRYREIRDRAYDEMLSRYEIILPDPETLAAEAGGTGPQAALAGPDSGPDSEPVAGPVAGPESGPVDQ